MPLPQFPIDDQGSLEAILEYLRDLERKNTAPPQPPVAQTSDASLIGRLAPPVSSLLQGPSLPPQKTILESAKDLGSKFVSGIAHPIDEGIPAAVQFGKGALSGATAGLSEYSDDLKIDPESWAASAGRLAGFAAPTGLAGLGVRGLSAIPGLGRLGGRLVSDAIGGGIVSGADEALRPKNEGEERHPFRAAAEGTALGAALPLVLRGLGSAARKVFGKDIPMPPESPTTTNVGDVPGPKKPGDSGIKPLDDLVSNFGKDAPKKAQTPPVAQDIETLAAEHPSMRGGMTGGPASGYTKMWNSQDIDNAVLEHPSLRGGMSGGYAKDWNIRGSAQQPDVTPLGGRPIETPGAAPAATAAVEDATPREANVYTDSWDRFKALGRKFNLPARIFRKDPAAREILTKAFDARDRMDLLSSETKQALDGAVGQLTKAEQDILHQTRLKFQGQDGIENALMQEAPDAASRMITANNALNLIAEANFQKLLDLGLVKKTDFIKNYTPMIRPRVITRNGIQVQIGDEWLPVGQFNKFQQAQSFMRKERNLDLPISQKMAGMSIQEANAIQAKAFAKLVAMEENVIRGGQGLQGTVKVGPNEVSWLQQKLDQIKDPRLADQMGTYLTDLMGTPRPSWMSQEMANVIRSAEFYHYIGTSLLAPMVNLTQNMIAWSKTSNTAFWKGAWSVWKRNTPMSEYVPQLKGVKDMEKLSASEFAERFMGASGEHYKGDVQLVEPNLFGSRTLGNLADKTASLFRATESYNQKTTAMAGFFDALARGKSLQEAITAGKELNRYANKFGGPENTPEIFRTPGASLMGQFKSFQIGMGGIWKDFAVDVKDGLVQMAKAGTSEEYHDGLRKVMPAVKYMVGVGALIGPAGMVKPAIGDLNDYDDLEGVRGQFRSQVRHLLEGIPKQYLNGFTGLIGANISNQIGLGALPIDNLRDAMWFLPGPALAHVMDMASAGSYLVARAMGNDKPDAGLDFSLANGNFLGSMSPDAAAAAITRSFPIGGPQIDRVRKYIHAFRTGGDEVAAYNLMQSLGLEPIPMGGRDLIRKQQPQPWLYEQLGVPKGVTDLNALVFNTPERQSEIEHRVRLVEEGAEYTQAIRDYATMASQGDLVGAERLRTEYERKNGVPLKISPEAMQGAFERRTRTAVDRMRDRLPPQLRAPDAAMPPQF